MEARGEPSAEGDDAPGGLPPYATPPSGPWAIDPDTGSLVIAGRWRADRDVPVPTASRSAAGPSALSTPQAFAPAPQRRSAGRGRGRVLALTVALVVVALGWAAAVVGGRLPDPSSAFWPPPGRTGTGSAGTSATARAAAPASAAGTSPTANPTGSTTGPSGSATGPSGSATDPSGSAAVSGGAGAGLAVADVPRPPVQKYPGWPGVKGPTGRLEFSIRETAELTHDRDVASDGGLRAWYRQDLALSAATVRRGKAVTMKILERIEVPLVDYLPGGRVECVGKTDREPAELLYGWQVGSTASANGVAVFGIYPATGDPVPRYGPTAQVRVKGPIPKNTDQRTAYSPDRCYGIVLISRSLSVKVPATLAPGRYRISPETPVKVNRLLTKDSGGQVVDLDPASADPTVSGTLPTITVTA